METDLRTFFKRQDYEITVSGMVYVNVYENYAVMNKILILKHI